jgi:histidinol-phosphate phosphatase family protein
MRSALFLDRDGIINARIVDGYVTQPEEFILLDDIVPVIRTAREAGALIIVITNQQGVGKGLMTEQDLGIVHSYMQRLLGVHAAAVDAIYVCTSLAGAGDPRRKPSPGMLLEALEDHHLAPERCLFIGDSVTDHQAGESAGIPTLLVGCAHQGADSVSSLPDVLTSLTFLSFLSLS